MPVWWALCCWNWQKCSRRAENEMILLLKHCSYALNYYYCSCNNFLMLKVFTANTAEQTTLKWEHTDTFTLHTQVWRPLPLTSICARSSSEQDIWPFNLKHLSDAHHQLALSLISQEHMNIRELMGKSLRPLRRLRGSCTIRHYRAFYTHRRSSSITSAEINLHVTVANIKG